MNIWITFTSSWMSTYLGSAHITLGYIGYIAIILNFAPTTRTRISWNETLVRDTLPDKAINSHSSWHIFINCRLASDLLHTIVWPIKHTMPYYVTINKSNDILNYANDYENELRLRMLTNTCNIKISHLSKNRGACCRSWAYVETAIFTWCDDTDTIKSLCSFDKTNKY